MQAKGTHSCPYDNCNYSFNRPYRLAQHLLIHENKKVFQCKEEGCTKSYTSNSHLIRHVNTAHKNTEPEYKYICQRCQKVFSNRQNLKKHMQVSQSCKLYLCDECKSEFKKKNLLRAHMYQHTGIKSFCCELCPKSFVTLGDKKKHKRRHKTYSCSKCSVVFHLWSKYQKHKKTDHTDNEFICDYCKRSFKMRIHIIRHIRKDHMSIRKMFRCPYKRCKKSYSKRSNLNCHVKTKHDKVRYKCSICDAMYSSKMRLKIHLNSHNCSVPVPSKIKMQQCKKRKDRIDKGTFKVSTAIKLAGIPSDFVNTPELRTRYPQIVENLKV